LARRFLADDDVLGLSFQPDALVVQTARPDAFYARLTELAASGEAGRVDEVTSPDDNLAAVFPYLVKWRDGPDPADAFARGRLGADLRSLPGGDALVPSDGLPRPAGRRSDPDRGRAPHRRGDERAR